MAFGLPCVVTTVGAFPELVLDGETGLLVPPGEVEPLADALSRLLHDPELGRQLGLAGRQRVENYLNWDSVVERMGPGLAHAAR
jgi:glycosyltransferase involved in cell wall biosynthesis